MPFYDASVPANTDQHDASLPTTPRVISRARGVVAPVQALVVSLIIDFLVILMLITLVWVVIGVAIHVWEAITTGTVDAFKSLSIELLTVFIFIELFHSLTEYVRFKRIRVTNLVDASLAFVLREVWVGMYAGEAHWQELMALAALVLALGGVRTLAVVYSPSERAADQAEAL